MRGRKPTPGYLKLVTGNPGHRPIKQARAEPQGGVPRPPSVLGTDALLEWRRVVPRLAKLGLLATIDRAALAAYCQTYEIWVTSVRALAVMAARDPVTAGLLIKTSNGNAIQNPLVGIINKAAAAMVRYAAEFGMTPSARSRVQGAPEGRDGDQAAAKYF